MLRSFRFSTVCILRNLSVSIICYAVSIRIFREFPGIFYESSQRLMNLLKGVHYHCRSRVLYVWAIWFNNLIECSYVFSESPLSPSLCLSFLTRCRTDRRWFRASGGEVGACEMTANYCARGRAAVGVGNSRRRRPLQPPMMVVVEVNIGCCPGPLTPLGPLVG